MTTDQTTRDNPAWGTPEPTPRRWGLRETAASVGVAAVIAALGGAAIYAATDTGSRLAGPHQGPGGMAGGPPPAAGIGMHGSGGPGTVGATAVHGEFVVPDGAGGYTTMLNQTGTVTAVSPTSITVRSADGYTQAYAIPASGANPPFAVDDPVSIRATRTGDTATVTNISNPPVGGPPQN
ncbi:hypothetical protein [Mycobacterium sp.]|uniref:hypothetical protein n=1 Tax=Mycobacterium sp. TaxID=1785 RepID=UPI002D86DA3F|nr:hypothetical protein [Mycobacterium sp.]